MKKLHLYLYGTIENFQYILEDTDLVNLSMIVKAVNEAKDYEAIVVHIHSPGGSVDEGFAIYDYLMSLNKPVEVIVEGLCASIATVVAMAGQTRKMTPNSQFMIHNPWGFAGGTAEELQKYTDMVQSAETKILNFYVEKTGASEDELKKLMDNETYLSAQQAKDLGFITEVIEPVKALALITKPNSMKKNPILAKLADSLKAILSTITEEQPKALDLKTQDGKMLTIETAGETPAVGDKVTLDGAPAPDGDYLMEDNSTIVVAGALISEIKPAASGEATPTPEQAQAAIKENEELKAQLKEQEEEIKALAAKVDLIAKNIKSTYKPKGQQGQFRETPKGEKNPVQEALEAKRLEKEKK